MKSNYPMRRFQYGLSLIELLVALSIGSFLIIGAVTMQSQTRRTFDVNEQQARVQENARYVVAVIEPELQLAGVFGYSQDPNTVMWDYSGSLTPAADLRMDSAAAPGLPEDLKVCGDNFAVDVLATVTAVNGTADEEEFALECDAEGGGYLPGTDVLVLRHTAPPVVDPDASKLQVYSERVAAQTNTRLFVGDVAPGPVEAEQADVRDMVVQAYYISQDSEGREGVPALRMKMLSSVGGVPTFIDQEVLRGVEDLQVQFGVDPGDDLDGDGAGDDPGGDGMADFVNGYASQYVNAGDALLDSAQVVAVRIWVRVRGDQAETGFVDTKTYQYADTEAFTPGDNFRRLVMSRTVYLRNSRQQ
jgi:type IV pilus assembly protein PilW